MDDPRDDRIRTLEARIAEFSAEATEAINTRLALHDRIAELERKLERAERHKATQLKVIRMRREQVRSRNQALMAFARGNPGYAIGGVFSDYWSKRAESAEKRVKELESDLRWALERVVCCDGGKWVNEMRARFGSALQAATSEGEKP
jgi:phage shock protein A